MSMIVGIIAENNINAVMEKVEANPNVDIFEWRLDYLSAIDIDAIKAIKEIINKPLIFTLRPKNQGGHYEDSEEKRIALLKKLSLLLPEYMDIEYTVAYNIITTIKKQCPSIKIICSYHNFEKTPENITNIWATMERSHVFIYKIITYANTIFDNFSTLHFIKNHSQRINVVSHCMGALGLMSRLLGATVGNYFHYASLSPSCSPIDYCPHVETLKNIYRLNQLNEATKIFALLGDPVEYSVGHIFHNAYFKKNNKNAVYVKIPLKKEELKRFFLEIKEFSFIGLSITMPLKEAIIPYVDYVEKRVVGVDAINTLFLCHGKWYGTNTDGIGAVIPIKKIRQLTNQCHVLIIGAGGAAKAIAQAYSYESIASLTILNRTLTKAHSLAKKVGGQGYNNETFKDRKDKTAFDVVINALPNNVADEAMIHHIVLPYITSNTIVMDIDYGHSPSILSKKAEDLKCVVISPQAMYEAQALEQINYWFGR